MTSPMPQIHSPQIILLVLCKQPIPSRIDILRPRHRKDVPSTCVREPPESCHDWNNLWKDCKSDKSNAQFSRSRIKNDVPHESNLGSRPSFKVASPMPQNPSPWIIQVYQQPIPCRINVQKPCYDKIVSWPTHLVKALGTWGQHIQWSRRNPDLLLKMELSCRRSFKIPSWTSLSPTPQPVLV